MIFPFTFSYGELVSRALAAAVFVGTAITDYWDGHLARKYGLITDFGKFIDPLADKFMVIGALLVILYKYATIRPVFIWAVIIVIFRELAVTSIRLVASSSSGVVIAANWLGKIKTCTQIACVCATIIEPLIYSAFGLDKMLVYLPLTYLTTALMIIFTLWSGINYIVSYWKYLDPQK
jgi:CDP-diacylglycerol--glycerol-3-phosphate 3-phosphatidyltransferase